MKTQPSKSKIKSGAMGLLFIQIPIESEFSEYKDAIWQNWELDGNIQYGSDEVTNESGYKVQYCSDMYEIAQKKGNGGAKQYLYLAHTNKKNTYPGITEDLYKTLTINGELKITKKLHYIDHEEAINGIMLNGYWIGPGIYAMR